MWSHYADYHKGLALGLDVTSSDLHKVSYENSRPRQGNLSDGTNEGFAALIKEAFTCKFKHWEYEEEYRLMVPLQSATKKKNLYFLPFSQNLLLSEVIIGPLSEITSKQIIDEIGNGSDTKIVTSRLAFRKFSVVEQKKASMKK